MGIKIESGSSAWLNSGSDARDRIRRSNIQRAKAMLLNGCDVFLQHSDLLTKPYEVGSRVDAGTFRVFVEAIGGSRVTITDSNLFNIEALGEEFAFASVSRQVGEWLSEHPSVDVYSRRVIVNLKATIEGQVGAISKPRRMRDGDL
jgi:hypothetical protein